MRIEKASASDVDELGVLFNEYRVFYDMPANLLAACEFLKERIDNRESVIFLSRNKKNTITGFVQLYPIFSSTRMKRLWLLNDLFVLPAFRGTGISVALMDAAKVFSKKTASCGLVLETSKTNKVANELYQRIGFVLDNYHNYYSWSE